MGLDLLLRLESLLFGVFSPSVILEIVLLAKLLLANVAIVLKPEVDLFLRLLSRLPLLLVLQPHMLVEVLPLVEGPFTVLTLVFLLLLLRRSGTGESFVHLLWNR